MPGDFPDTLPQLQAWRDGAERAIQVLHLPTTARRHLTRMGVPPDVAGELVDDGKDGIQEFMDHIDTEIQKAQDRVVTGIPVKKPVDTILKGTAGGLTAPPVPQTILDRFTR